MIDIIPEKAVVSVLGYFRIVTAITIGPMVLEQQGEYYYLCPEIRLERSYVEGSPYSLCVLTVGGEWRFAKSYPNLDAAKEDAEVIGESLRNNLKKYGFVS